jgi:hypothetical protein
MGGWTTRRWRTCDGCARRPTSTSAWPRGESIFFFVSVWGVVFRVFCVCIRRGRIGGYGRRRWGGRLSLPTSSWPQNESVCACVVSCWMRVRSVPSLHLPHPPPTPIHTHTHTHHSIAPNIFGHMDIKRGLLLMMLGGVHKSTKEVRERGKKGSGEASD